MMKVKGGKFKKSPLQRYFLEYCSLGFGVFSPNGHKMKFVTNILNLTK